MADEINENDLEIDMEAAKEELGESLFGAEEPESEATDQVETTDSPADTEGTDAADSEVQELPVSESTDTVDQEVVQPQTAPKTWRKEAAAAWDALPQVVKDEIAKRESDMFSGIESYKVDAQIGKGVKEILAPHMAFLQHYQIDPGSHISSLLETHQILALGQPAQKVQILRNIAQQFGVDLAELSAELPAVDPQIAELNQKIAQLETQTQQSQQSLYQQRQNEVQAQIDAFASDPANIYFDALLPTMTTLLRQGVAKDLSDAYNQAIWLDPDVRQKELSRQAAEKTKQDNERAAKAKAAAAPNVRSQAKPVSTAAPVGSMDETLESTFAAIKQRNS